jgi:hypothetical protein
VLLDVGQAHVVVVALDFLIADRAGSRPAVLRAYRLS